MKHTAIMLSDSLDRVSAYFSANPPWTTATPAPANLATYLQQLNDVRATLEQYMTSQASSKNTALHQGAIIQSLREALWHEHLVPIRRIARAMLPESAGLVKQFDAPGLNANSKKLIQSARAIANDAVPYQSVLVANGRPADFIDQLNAAANALEAAKTAQANAISVRKRASAEINKSNSAGRQAIHYLDAIMHSCFGKSPAIMAQWHQAKRVQLTRSNVKRKKSDPSTGQTPSTLPATPVTPAEITATKPATTVTTPVASATV